MTRRQIKELSELIFCTLAAKLLVKREDEPEIKKELKKILMYDERVRESLPISQQYQKAAKIVLDRLIEAGKVKP
jgi:hypothetical protein